MKLHRRNLIISSGASGLLLAGTNALAAENSGETPGPQELESESERLARHRKIADGILANIIGERPIRKDLIEATAPDIAEDGSSVPVSFHINCSMIGKDYPSTVYIIGMVNPTPEIARYHFTKECGEASVVLRCRMHASSDLMFVAQMADGTVGAVGRYVSVTAGGCT